MGYDLHITRKKDWSDEDGMVITPEEWLAIIRDDPELSLAGEGYGPYTALWSGPSEYPDPWIDYSEDGLYSKNPDGPLIDKMVQLARSLDAKAQGDDGEIYSGGGDEPYYEDVPNIEEVNERPQKISRPWWQRLVRM